MKQDIMEELKTLKEDFQRMSQDVYTGMGKAILTGCLLVERDAKKLFKPKDSESVPGEPPRVDTGRLRASISHRIIDQGAGLQIVGEVGTNVEYGIDLEFGSSKNWRHPFMGPAYDMNEKKIDDLISAATEAALGGKNASS